MATKTTPRCPLRPGDPCSLCQPGADGPHNCGLVYLVMDDPDLRELYIADRRARVGRDKSMQNSHPCGQE